MSGTDTGWSEMVKRLNVDDVEVQEPKGKAQRTQYLQDVSAALYRKAKSEFEQDSLKQHEYGIRGEYGPDVSPPSGFIIFARTKICCKQFNILHGDNVPDEICKVWVSMGDFDKKPWEDCSEQLQSKWREI